MIWGSDKIREVSAFAKKVMGSGVLPTHTKFKVLYTGRVIYLLVDNVGLWKAFGFDEMYDACETPVILEEANDKSKYIVGYDMTDIVLDQVRELMGGSK